MVRGLAFAVALVATNAFVPGTTPVARQSVAQQNSLDLASLSLQAAFCDMQAAEHSGIYANLRHSAANRCFDSLLKRNAPKRAPTVPGPNCPIAAIKRS